MSEIELNVGKLRPTDKTKEYFIEYFKNVYENLLPDWADDWDEVLSEVLYAEGYIKIDGKYYSFENVCDSDCYGFSKVFRHPDGTIDYITYHYNGGAFWTEVLEAELKRTEKGD